MSQLAPPSEPTQSATPAETAVFEVEGMMCAGCVSTVEKKLLQCEGVQSATVNLITEVASVDYASGADLSAIADALTVAGYPSHLRQNSGSKRDLGHDSSTGVSVSQDLQSKSDWVTRKEKEQQGQTRQLTVAGCLLLLSTLGHLQHLNIAKSSPLNAWLTLPVISTLWFHGILATLVLIFPARKILIEGFQGVRRRSPNMNTLVTLGALSAYTTSLVALIFPTLGWECFFDEPVMLLSFILIGQTLEQRARFQAASSLRSLIALQPAQARRIATPPDQLSNADLIPAAVSTEIEDVQIPVSQVKVGDWLRVLPGEKIPVDGIITRGQTTIDESMITGESLPAFRQSGDQISGGMLNQSGAIALEVSRTGSETTLGQMIQLVETAQTRKAPIQGLADLLSGYFTYGVLICAALTFGFWYLVGVPLWPETASAAMGHAHHMALSQTITSQSAASSIGPSATHLMSTHLSQAADKTHISTSFRLLVSLKLAIAVVVVACPCALGLATPTAILVGSGIGAEKGLLIRGGDILEATHKLDIIVFDKTGTLTSGSPQVTDCLPLSRDISVDDLLQIAATVEKGTQHPLAVAITKAAAAKQLPLLAAEDFYTQAGLGISATIKKAALPSATSPSVASQPVQVWLGNLAWMQQNDCAIADDALQLAESLAEGGKTAVFVAQNHQLIGLIGASDTLRPEAAETIAQIQKLGITVQILSGDRLAAVGAIAHQLGIAPSQIQAEVSPAQKVSAIRQLQQTRQQVGLVGDGINDAPALAQADVGIALNSGTDVAMETADIVLMKDTLTDVPAAIRLSRRTFNKIRQNLGWAFAYNLICIPLAAGAFLPAFGLSLSPGFAGGLMALSSITVVLNSLLLKVRSPALTSSE